MEGTRSQIATILAVAVLVVFSATRETAGQSIQLREVEAGQEIVVADLPEPVIAQLRGSSREEMAKALRITVGQETTDDQPPMLGKYEVSGAELVFKPRFPLRAGVTYRVTFKFAVENTTAQSVSTTSISAIKVFDVPFPADSKAATVATVFPSGDLLPENLLRFYIHFTAPMRQGDSYRHIQILDEDGKVVADPFVDVGQELWDRSGKRITLIFDPGRIKRGVRPREEIGPIFQEGKSYSLVVNNSWHGADGRPLVETYRKSFRVGPPDDVQPNIHAWRVHSPPAGGQEPLVIDLAEPLDQAQLLHVISIKDAGGAIISGQVEVAAGEAQWRFTPEAKWAAGEYQIVVETTLEDRAANSIAKPFEVDVFDKIETKTEIETVTLPLVIK